MPRARCDVVAWVGLSFLASIIALRNSLRVRDFFLSSCTTASSASGVSGVFSPLPPSPPCRWKCQAIQPCVVGDGACSRGVVLAYAVAHTPEVASIDTPLEGGRVCAAVSGGASLSARKRDVGRHRHSQCTADYAMCQRAKMDSGVTRSPAEGPSALFHFMVRVHRFDFKASSCRTPIGAHWALRLSYSRVHINGL